MRLAENLRTTQNVPLYFKRSNSMHFVAHISVITNVPFLIFEAFVACLRERCNDTHRLTPFDPTLFFKPSNIDIDFWAGSTPSKSSQSALSYFPTLQSLILDTAKVRFLLSDLSRLHFPPL
jgi:hypothetical protein